jgi:hypothetical protein
MRNGKPYTVPCDIYAAGIFIKIAFVSYAQSLSAPQPTLIPRRLWEVCDKCTSHDPANRPEAIKAVFELEQIHDQEFKDDDYGLVGIRELLEKGSVTEVSSKGENDSGVAGVDSRFQVAFSLNSSDFNSRS